jgi:hypothetical protein
LCGAACEGALQPLGGSGVRIFGDSRSFGDGSAPNIWNVFFGAFLGGAPIVWITDRGAGVVAARVWSVGSGASLDDATSVWPTFDIGAGWDGATNVWKGAVELTVVDGATIVWRGGAGVAVVVAAFVWNVGSGAGLDDATSWSVDGGAGVFVAEGIHSSDGSFSVCSQHNVSRGSVQGG